MSSGPPKKPSMKTKSQSQTDDGPISLVALYVGAAIVGGVLIAGVGIYLAWPSATQIASATADGVLTSMKVINSAHDLIVASINQELGYDNWREIEFHGPIPAEPIRLTLVEELGDQPVVERYAQADTGSSVARIIIYVSPSSGHRAGRQFRIYWIGGDRSVSQIESTEPGHGTVMSAIERSRVVPAK